MMRGNVTSWDSRDNAKETPRTAEEKEGSCREGTNVTMQRSCLGTSLGLQRGRKAAADVGKRKKNDFRNTEGRKAAVKSSVDDVREEETDRTT